jgi:iron complex outermembrane receptor protein
MTPSIRFATLAVAASLSFAATAAEEGAIIVTANRIATADREATYATEVHDRASIEASGASTLFDYLSRHSSLQVSPSFGNREAPKLDMRGYGIENGHQNLVITVDGVRLNAIDSGTPLLGGIALADIERIEITKGSGAVLYGDGAMAGTIQIHTRRSAGHSVTVRAGNFGAMDAAASTAHRSGPLSLTATATRNRFDGTSAEDPTGHRDESRSDTWRLRGDANVGDWARLRASVGEADIDTRYVNPLSLAQFLASPAQGDGNAYTHQLLDSEFWKAGADLWFGDRLRVVVDHQREDRRSEFKGAFPFVADYEMGHDDIALHLETAGLTAIVGGQLGRGDRFGTGNITSKDNEALFAQLQARIGPVTASAGARRETVEYRFQPTGGTASVASHRLNAWDIGANWQVGPALSVFANHARAFQAPDIDRFFDFGGAFNAFIDPARSRTSTVGLHHVTARNRAQLSAFYADLDDEIYLVPGIFLNTNIDQSHKYGLELQDDWQLGDTVATSLNYAWTRAIIDREDQGGGAFDGKDLPGVPRHGLTVTVSWQIDDRTVVAATHAWRSSAYAMNDFSNDNVQRQAAYAGTGVSARYRVRDELELLAAIDNLFERKNGLWVDDDAIYPVDFARSWRVGLNASF